MSDERNGNGRIFITNKWLVGVLVALIISMGGYIFTNMDRSHDVDTARADATERRVNKLEIDQAAMAAESRAQYNEILRRLDAIDRNIWRRTRDAQ